MGKKLGTDPRRVENGGIQGMPEARVGLAIDGASTSFRRCAIINLFDLPVKDSDILESNPDIRGTRFMYGLRYQPCMSREGTADFVINADIIDTKEKIRVHCFDQLKQMAKSIPEVAWLLRNTNLNDDLFAMAKININIRIPIAFDAVEYARKIGDVRLDSQLSTVQATDQATIRYNNIVVNKIMRSQKARRQK